MSADINLQGDIFLITGNLCYNTVKILDIKSKKLFIQVKKIVIDFSGVKKCDSGALALVIEWIKFAKSKHKKLILKSFPSRLISLASAANINELIEVFCYLEDAPTSR